MSDYIITEKMQIVSTLHSYYVHSIEGHFIKEIVEILTQGRNWVRDFQKLINSHKHGYDPGDLPDRHLLSKSVFFKLLKSRLIDPVPWVNCYDPIWIAYTFRDVELTWLLLKYNVGCVRKMEDIPKLKPLIPIMEKYLELNTPNLIQEFLKEVGDYPFLSRRRLKVVLWGLDTISYLKNPSIRRYKVMCLRTFFEFIPEPCIASAEIGGIMKHIIGNQSGSNEFVNKVCQTFETHYPESSEPYQPRSLKHLSRCCILQNLRRARRLPQGVDQLLLPQILKNYILPNKCPFLAEDIGIHPNEFSFHLEGVNIEEGFSEEDEFSEDDEFYSDIDSDDEFYSSDETLSEEDSEQSEIDTDHPEQLKLNLRTRKFLILKRTQF